MATKAMIQEIEEKAIEDFRTEFAELCKKHGIGAIVVGARSETEKIEDIPDESMCAAFCSSHIEDPSLNQLKAIDTAFDKAEEEIISKMQRDIARRILGKKGINIEDLAKGLGEVLEKAFGGECDCENCKKEKGIKFSKDGDKICATFEDFVNLQESPAGFGDTEEEAKADLLKNTSAEKNEK